MTATRHISMLHSAAGQLVRVAAILLLLVAAGYSTHSMTAMALAADNNGPQIAQMADRMDHQQVHGASGIQICQQMPLCVAFMADLVTFAEPAMLMDPARINAGPVVLEQDTGPPFHPPIV